MKRYSNMFSYGQWLGLGEDKAGDLVKYKDVEQLQALTKRLAEGIVLQVEHGSEIDLWSKEFIEAQQYLDSLKENV